MARFELLELREHHTGVEIPGFHPRRFRGNTLVDDPFNPKGMVPGEQYQELFADGSLGPIQKHGFTDNHKYPHMETGKLPPLPPERE